MLDAGEPSTTTAANGTFSFSNLDTAAVAGKNVIVQGGTYLDPLGNAVAFNGKLIALPPAAGTTAAVTPFSTLKAAGLSDAALTQLLGKTPESLTTGDFAAGSGTEDVGVKLFEMLSNPALGLTSTSSGDKFLAVAKAVATTIQTAFNGGLDLSQPGAMDSLIELAEQNALAAATAYDAAAGADGVVTDAEQATLEANVQAATVADLNTEAAKLAAIAYAAARGASVEFDASGNFLRYRITESQLASLGGVDQFAGAPTPGQLYVDVEGTLLGTDTAPITFAQLNALGVDGLSGDDLAPYLRLLPGNIAGVGAAITLDMAGVTNGAVAGTELDATDTGIAGGLGVSTDVAQGTLAGYLGGAGWDDPLGQD
jgi:hypothetical protein